MLKNKSITENFVEKAIRNYLSEEKGWELTNLPKGPGEHGIDIKAFHKKWRKFYRIECKGDNQVISSPKIHNSFNNVLGQILSRMDKEGKNTNNNRAIIYAIGIPKHWEGIFKNKITKMKFGWKLLKLKTFLVEDDLTAKEVGYTYFLK